MRMTVDVVVDLPLQVAQLLLEEGDMGIEGLQDGGEGIPA